ncbi:TPA: hypothetical protein G9F27_004524 [Salmonella enterica]|uniref:Uncharacterized protein n=1 Tax=Salmonella enterica TaxID=28901 RepID=A0A743P9B3_SALER|nr:hypothetical protein [Salmonella enterica]
MAYGGQSTYMVSQRNSVRKNRYCGTIFASCVSFLGSYLEAEELESIAHVFFDNYGLSFSDILKKIVIGQPDFPCPDIALLDGP